MHRFHLLFLLPALLTLPAAPGLLAQSASPSQTPVASGALEDAPQTSAGTRSSASRSSGPTWSHRLLSGAGEALLGAWVGYMSSQVERGDWARDKNSAKRGVWTGAGAALGFTLGFSFPLGSAHKQPGPPPTSVLPPGLPSGRSVITAEDIERSGAKTAYEVVQDLRPDWLPQRTQSLTYGYVMANNDIPVYQDSTRIGGLEELSKLPVANVEAIYRLDRVQAMARFGDDAVNGVLLVISKH